MARAEIAIELGADRQRQEARGRGNPRFLDDDGAVVERRRRLEDRCQQVVAERGVDGNAALDVVAQPDLALEDDDRANASLREQARGRDDFLDALG